MANFRELRRVYGFDEVAIVPGSITINPDMTDTSFSLGNVTIDIPILGSAMDAVASPSFAGEMHKQGAISVMNLEGVQTRYDDPQEAIEGSIRKLYGTDLGQNAVHGSDSDENAKKEIAFFFTDYELI